MYIVEVIPIGSGMPTDTLTYYSKDICHIGDMVSINIGKTKDVKALVIDIDSLVNRKQDIKDKDWMTKKINGVLKSKVIDSKLLLAIYKTSVEYILPTGILLSMLISKKLWDKLIDINETTFLKNEILKKKESDIIKTLHIVPTQNELRAIKKENQNDKAKNNKYRGNKAQNSKQKNNEEPEEQNVYSTPSLDYILTEHIKSITIHNPDSFYYQHAGRKRNMYRIIQSAIDNYNLLITDKNQAIDIYTQELTYDLSKVNIIRDEFTYITPLISTVTDRLIRNVYANYQEGGMGKILIYANRKGESPLSRCYDCGLDMLCPICNMPLVLHKSTKSHPKSDEYTIITPERYYQCHHCDYYIPVDKEMACSHCGGWRMMPIGISTGSIESHLRMHYTFIKSEEELEQKNKSIDNINGIIGKEDINKNVKDYKLPVYRLDAETASTPNKVNSILASWQAHGGILITNDTGINDRSIPNLQANYSIVISLDGLYSLPVPDIDIKLLHIINRLDELTKSAVYVHTHLSHNAIYNIVDLISLSKNEDNMLTNTDISTAKTNQILIKEIQELKVKIDNKLKIAKMYPYYNNINIIKSKNIINIIETIHKLNNLKNTELDIIECNVLETKAGDDLIIKVLRANNKNQDFIHISLYVLLIKENIKFNL